jgi:hypothetical protein
MPAGAAAHVLIGESRGHCEQRTLADRANRGRNFGSGTCEQRPLQTLVRIAGTVERDNERRRDCEAKCAISHAISGF